MRWLADTQRALQAVERLQAKLKERGEVPTEEKLSLLKSVLQSPLFHQILALQKSVQHLRDQVIYEAKRNHGYRISFHLFHMCPFVSACITMISGIQRDKLLHCLNLTEASSSFSWLTLLTDFGLDLNAPPITNCVPCYGQVAVRVQMKC